MVKIGDKVRFLDQQGGGIVRRFDSKDIVFVEDEDGFEIPVTIKQCVVVATAGEMAMATGAMSGGASGSNVVQKPTFDKPVMVRESKEGDLLNVCLAFIPNNTRSLQKSAFDTYLVNDSNYWLIYSYAAQEGELWRVRKAGMIEPHQKLYLEQVNQEDINELEHVSIQVVAFKQDKLYDIKPAVSVDIRIDTVKFYKLHTFVENKHFNEGALMYHVIKNDLPQRSVLISDQKIQKAIQEKAIVEVFKTKKVKPYNVRNGVLEVDIHIDSIVETTAGFSNRDMLEYQLEYVEKILAEYKGNKGQKIVFIHGKGDGVLRDKLTKMLERKYRAYNYQDASFKEYGYGATMVTIK